MPATTKAPKAKFVPLPDAPTPWKRVKPGGLHIFHNAITKRTRDNLWKFFHPKTGGPEGITTRTGAPEDGEFPWYQRFKRFPKTAHFNGWHSGKYLGTDGGELFAKDWPELYAAITEAIRGINNSNVDMSDVPSWGGFVPESVSSMRHKKDWGLGAHYDNAHDEGVGVVVMLSISADDTVPRRFKFDDPPRGRQFELNTPDSSLVVFGGECYDEWRHMSLHNKHQAAECISMTVRLAGVCGNGGTSGSYSTGAPAAQRVAHGRIAKKMAIAKLSAKCAKQACAAALAQAAA